MSYKKFLKERLKKEGFFSKGKSQEEMLAKSLLKILKDKTKMMSLDPKTVLNYMMEKLQLLILKT